MTKKRDLFLGYLAIIFSITLTFILINNFSARSAEKWRFFYAFTQQSNIIVLVWLVLFGIHAFTKKLSFVRNRVLMTAITVYISITYLIVALVLNPIYSGSWNPLVSGSEFWLHHLTPVVMWIYYFLVKGEGKLNIVNSLLTLSYPLLYFFINLIIGATLTYQDGSKAYAYFFINPDTYKGSYLILMLVMLGLLLVFSGFTFLLSKMKTYIDIIYHSDQII